MKFGIRTPSLKKSLAARTSIKRQVGIKMPKGYGWVRNPKKYAYNKVYNQTTVSFWDLLKKLFITKS
jgi:hypothetical protein